MGMRSLFVMESPSRFRFAIGSSMFGYIDVMLMKLLRVLTVSFFFGLPIGALAETCQFNSQPPMPCSITYTCSPTYSGDCGIGSTMTIKWRDGVTQVYRQSSNGGHGGGGKFYLYTDKYGGEWLWGMPGPTSRFGLHNSNNGNKIYFW